MSVKGEAPMEPKRDIEGIEKRYLREIGRYPVLSINEERELALKARAGDLEARKKLILCNLKLVVKIARSHRSGNVPLLDLIEEGNLGLIKAVSKFEPEKGFRFSTYASWWIRQAIEKAVSNYSRTIRIPIHIFQLVTKYIAMEQDPSSSRLTSKEKARRLGLSAKRFRALEVLLENIRALDLASSLDAYEQLAHSEHEADPAASDPEQVILRQIESSDIEELLDRLSDRERLILRIRYGLQDGEPRTLAETGILVNVSRERIRQVESRALRKLRMLLEPSGARRHRKKREKR